MNLILFTSEEVAEAAISRSDPRARHLLEILRREPGEPFDAGLLDGPRGKGWIEHMDRDRLRLRFAMHDPPPALFPITLAVGLPRPQTARKILQEATTLGVEQILFFRSEKGESAYASSRLWTTGEYRRHLVAGAEQAFCTRLPTVQFDLDFSACLRLAASIGTRVALDNYEATCALPEAPRSGLPVALFIGPERGWSGSERHALRGAGFTLAHLGSRVLRTETACTAGLAVMKTRFNCWQPLA